MQAGMLITSLIITRRCKINIVTDKRRMRCNRFTRLLSLIKNMEYTNMNEVNENATANVNGVNTQGEESAFIYPYHTPQKTFLMIRQMM